MLSETHTRIKVWEFIITTVTFVFIVREYKETGITICIMDYYWNPRKHEYAVIEQQVYKLLNTDVIDNRSIIVP